MRGKTISWRFLTTGSVVLLCLLLMGIVLDCKQKTEDVGSEEQKEVLASQLTGNGGDFWVEMGKNSASGGGISNDAGESLSPAIAIGRDGNPIATWANDFGAGGSALRLEIYVKRWNGSLWLEIGTNSASGSGISNTIGDSTRPDIVIDRAGNPIICWRNDQGPGLRLIGQVYVRRWNGSSWVEMGKGSASRGGISKNQRYSSRPSIALGSESNPIICWGQMLGQDAQIHVKHWDGAAWVEMKEIPASIKKVKSETRPGVRILPPVVKPKVEVGPDGNPIVCWTDYSSGNYEIYVKRWDGAAWVEMGKSSASGGGISGSVGASYNPAIAIDRDGKPIICWEDRTHGNGEIYVRRWDGSAWVEIGTGSASGGGISNDSTRSWTPDVGISSDGGPVICWSTGKDIYLSRWDGSSWVEMGEGSASEEDISKSIRDAESPAIAIGSDDNPIIVFDSRPPDGDHEIYVRKFSVRGDFKNK